MSDPNTIPLEVDELTADWFTGVLDRDVTSAEVIETSFGTTGRARVALSGAADVPASVFVKLRPVDEDQRALVDMTGMGVAEARFYRDIASEVAVRVPAVWYADTVDDRYVMVLEDLVASGCTFPSVGDPDIGDRARDIVEQLALLHAMFWDSDRFSVDGDLHWLTQRMMINGELARMFIQNAVDLLGDRMDDSFHRLAGIMMTEAENIETLWNEGTRTLIHGDAHMGNLFVDVAAGGRTGFLDWAVLTCAPGIRDIAYVLCNSVPDELRKREERHLLELYCERLSSLGVELDPDTAWMQYRLFAVYSWVAAAATAGMGSKWQPSHIGVAATERATAACAHLDAVGLLEELLV